MLLAEQKGILNRITPLQQKHVRVNNNSSFINKTILKAIMKQTRSKNEFIKYRCEGNKSLQSKKKLCLSGKKSKKRLL